MTPRDRANYDEAVHLVHRAFCEPDHELVGEWDRSMAEAMQRNGYALVRVFEAEDAEGWQAVNDKSGAVTHGATPAEAVSAFAPAPPPDALRAALDAGDALNVAGGSRNAGAAGAERDRRTRAEWFAASSRWHEVSGRLRAALAATTTPAPDVSEAPQALDVERLARALQWLDTPIGGLFQPLQPYYEQAEAIAAEYAALAPEPR